jgi:hypothetical protein
MSWLIEIVEEKTRGKIINGLKKQEKIKSLVLSFRRQF